MTTLEILKCALDIIKDPKHWTQGSYARDKNSKEVQYYSSRAVRYCAVGAIKHCAAEGNADYAPSVEYTRGRDALEVLTGDSPKEPINTIVTVNDRGGRTVAHERVIQLFDEAIAREEAK